jgi:hypothetical protein
MIFVVHFSSCSYHNYFYSMFESFKVVSDDPRGRAHMPLCSQDDLRYVYETAPAASRSCFNLMACGAPLAFHELSIRDMMSSMPLPCFTCAKTVGPPSLLHMLVSWAMSHAHVAMTYRIRPASLSMTAKSAPTASARSVLLITNKSLCVIPGPPLRGTLSPPATSIT